MRSVRLLLAPLALVSPLAAGCGHDAPSVPKSAVAVVGEQTITRAQYAALMAQARQSYAARKEPFPQAGTSAYANLKASAVRLLVEQAELEQKAPELGVTIDVGQVEARRRLLIDETFGGSEARYRARLREERMTDAQIRSALRAQLLSQAVSEAVTAGVTVSAQAVQQLLREPSLELHPAGNACDHPARRRPGIDPPATARGGTQAALCLVARRHEGGVRSEDGLCEGLCTLERRLSGRC